MKRVSLCVVFVAMLLLAGVAQATIIQNFKIFTNNGNYNDNPGFNISLDIFSSSNQVVFEFKNNSTFDSTVAAIYFDDDSLLSFDHVVNFIINQSQKIGTKFAEGGSPGNLPAGNDLSPHFQTSLNLYATADSPPAKWGIDPGEKLQIYFNFKTGKTINDIQPDLNDGSLRIGLHVISLPDGSSESAVNIPEPATVALLGLGGLFLSRRKK